MIFLIDHNLNGHALIFFGSIANQGWLDIIPISFVTFAQMELPIDSDDRVVWRLAQENQMILLTANRSMKGKDSLEQVMREESSYNSLPVIIANKYKTSCKSRFPILKLSALHLCLSALNLRFLYESIIYARGL